ncbi:MAG: LacI family DNA-binding transcriptional regulator [Phycisphaerales bacterium]|nr:LacI family DNA-binding transcriptional regulator [Phycisphaerales bacterium]
MKSTTTRPIRLKDIATRAEISVAAVSMALADHPDISTETKRQVRELSQVLGYRRAGVYMKGESTQRRLERIGLVFIGGRSAVQPHSILPRALARQAQQNNFRLEIIDIESIEDPGQVIEQTVNFGKMLDGLIISGYADERLLEALNEKNIPCVIIGHILLNDADLGRIHRVGHTVASDEMYASQAVVGRLIELGHRRIAFASENAPRGLCHWQWLMGYKLALMEHGQTIDPQLIAITGRKFAGPQIVQQFSALGDPPTAYLVPDITTAHSLVQAHAAAFPDAGPLHKSLICGGNPEMLEIFGMNDYPVVMENADMLVTAAVNRLAELRMNPLPQPTQLTIAPIMLNFP